MNDRELLELAAKAAGLRLSEHQTSQEGAPLWLDREHANPVTHSRDWNPLTDDGDALRLAVSLGIDLEWRADGRVAAYRHATSNGYCFTALESSREDRAAATRRAIVRAAAEIGKEMP